MLAASFRVLHNRKCFARVNKQSRNANICARRRQLDSLALRSAQIRLHRSGDLWDAGPGLVHNFHHLPHKTSAQLPNVTSSRLCWQRRSLR